MAMNMDCGQERGTTTTTCYTKEFIWEIEQFTDWWSSREIAKSNRNDSTTWLEEIDHEKPQEWTKSTSSPILTFEIEGVVHEFRLAILKYDSWDRFDDEHCIMMGISLFYNGPSESVIVKPLFYLRNSGKEFGREIQAQTLKRGSYSEARIFSGYGFDNDTEQFAKENFIVMCLAKVNVLKECPDISRVGNQLASTRSFDQCLSDGFDCSAEGGDLEQFLDFKIVCVEKTDDGDEIRTPFRCHRLVLFLKSPYFKRLFSGRNVNEYPETTIVTDVSSVTMTKIIKYVYTGTISKSEIDIDLWNASFKYQIEPLHTLCGVELGITAGKMEQSQ